MQNKFETEQEAFWAGDFGNDYMSRNFGEKHIAANTALFARALRLTREVSSVIEFGPNVGLNLKAIKHLFPHASLTGVEINAKAAEALAENSGIQVHNKSLLSYEPKEKHDLAFVKGVLIHINPEELPKAYSVLARSTKKYVIIAEYYSRNPMSLTYRGHHNRLWKRDFAGEFMNAHPEFLLVDYGFVYYRDPNFPKDDVTWFLMEKK